MVSCHKQRFPAHNGKSMNSLSHNTSLWGSATKVALREPKYTLMACSWFILPVHYKQNCKLVYSHLTSYPNPRTVYGSILGHSTRLDNGADNQTPVGFGLDDFKASHWFRFIKTQNLRAGKDPCHLSYQPLRRDERTGVSEAKVLPLNPSLINTKLRPHPQTRS